MKKLTLIAVLLTLGLIVNAQKTVTTQNLIWLHYNGIVNLNKWKLDIEVEERSYIMPIRQHQLFLPRLTASYGINDNWSLGVGGAYFRHSRPFFPDEEIMATANEYRPHLDLVHKAKAGKFLFNSRLRIEERWLENTNTNSDIRFNRITRPRIMIMAKLNVFDQLTIQAGDELFLNVEGNGSFNTFDHNRILAGLSWSISEKTKLDLMYINWYEQIRGSEYFNRHILRLSFSHILFEGK